MGAFESISQTTPSFSSLAIMDSSDPLVNGGSAPPNGTNPTEEEEEVDPIWLSSRTARQIYGLCQVEKVGTRHHLTAGTLILCYMKDIGRLLSLAASSISLLTLPQTDPPDAALPQGAERSEKFVLVVSEYFERLDVSPTNLNLSMALYFFSLSFFSPVQVNSNEYTVVSGAYPAVKDRTFGYKRPS